MKKKPGTAPRAVRVKPAAYRSSRAELREEFEMPRWSSDHMLESSAWTG